MRIRQPAPASGFRRRCLLLVLAVVSTAYLAQTALFSDVTLQNLIARQKEILAFYEQSPATTVLAYVSLYVVSTALTIPIAVPLSIAGGMLFGFWKGTLLVAFAATTGATLSFLAARHLLRAHVEQRFGHNLKTLNDYIRRDGIYYLFTIRLIPVFPFFLINILLGLTPIRTFDYMWVSFTGMLAGTMVYVNAGVEFGKVRRYEDIMTPQIMTALVLFGLVPLVLKKSITAWSSIRTKHGEK